MDTNDDPLRPAPVTPWLEQARAVLASIGVGRIAGVVVGTVMALVAGWWLLQPPPPPVEDSLPLASAASVPTSSPAEGTPLPAGSGPAPAPVGDVLVHVAGEVRVPGVYRLSEGDRVIDAVERAGGALRRADLDAVNLAAPVVDGAQVFIPGQGDQASGGAPVTGSPPAGGVEAGQPVDLNRADAAALDLLPGVGPATAAAIVRHRDENGPFATVDDLLDVAGIGPAKLEALRDLVTA
jgi:competence protein ComEA